MNILWGIYPLDMVSSILLFSLILIIFIKNFYTNLPPGPLSWPLVGNMMQLGKQGHLQLSMMRKKYGNVFRIYFGSQLVIVVSGRKSIEQCFITRTVLFSMRPLLFTSQFILKGTSFAFAKMNVATHLKYKQCAITALKHVENGYHKRIRKNLDVRSIDEGMLFRTTNSPTEEMFTQEANALGKCLVDISSSRENMSLETTSATAKLYSEKFYEIILRSVVNTMSGTIFGQRYENEDSELALLTQHMLNFKKADGKVALLNFIPLLRKFWKQDLDSYVALSQNYTSIVERHIQRQNETLTNIQNNRNSVKLDRESKNKLGIAADLLKSLETEGGCTTKDMVVTLAGDLFGAGVDTTSVALTWLTVYFAKFPHHTKKIQASLDCFYEENERLPMYKDRQLLPCVMAFIQEVLRHCSPIPFTIPHTPVRDTTLDGYSIPHGALVMISLWSLNRDPTTWGDPDDFRPERFIRETGELNKSLADKVNVHGGGRRRCPGKTLSEILLFVFTVNLLRTCNFESFGPNKGDLPKALLGISLTPETIDISVIERSV